MLYFGNMIPKELRESKLIRRLTTPEKVQSFLDSIPINHEEGGETCMSPLRVLRERKAHCIEGALFAAVCLSLQGERPLVVNLKVHQSPYDHDHIITLFKRNGYFGAISKTNHVVLRYRDQVYRSVRELVMSYFHEYFLYKTGRKILRGYSKPINVMRFGTKWLTDEEDLWDIAEKIYDTPYIPIVPDKNQRYLRPAQPFERKICEVSEWQTKDTSRKTSKSQ